MRALLLFISLLAHTALLGQTSDAEFPGGNSAMLKHVQREMRYPPEAAELRLQGKVHLKLEIDSTGTLTLATIERGRYPQLDAEALRLVHTFPQWIPATREGRPIASVLYLPIHFDLSDLIGQPADVIFLLYRTSIQERKGEQAVHCLHPTTIAYFDNLAALIKTANETELKAASPYEIATALIVRQLMERKQMKGLNGRKLFRFLVDKGIIGKSSVGSDLPIDYLLKGEVAYLQFQDDYYVHMVRDGWDWRIELTLSFPALNENIRMLARSEGMELLAFIISSVEARTGKALSSKIWKAPFSK